MLTLAYTFIALVVHDWIRSAFQTEDPDPYPLSSGGHASGPVQTIRDINAHHSLVYYLAYRTMQQKAWNLFREMKFFLPHLLKHLPAETGSAAKRTEVLIQ